MNEHIIRLPKNDVGKDYIVGDIHGCYTTLMRTLGVIGFNFETDRLFSVGDIIDRGPENMECINLLGEPWFYAVRGNHEDMAILTYGHGYSDTRKMWLANGGEWAKHMEALSDAYPAYIYRRLRILPCAIVVGEGDDRFNVIHAEPYFKRLDGNGKLIDQPHITDDNIDQPIYQDHHITAMLWGRSLINGSMSVNTDNLSPTYVGHSTTKMPVKYGSVIYLDTGAYETSLNNDAYMTIFCHNDDIAYSYNPSTGILLRTAKHSMVDIVEARKQRELRKTYARLGY